MLGNIKNSQCHMVNQQCKSMFTKRDNFQYANTWPTTASIPICTALATTWTTSTTWPRFSSVLILEKTQREGTWGHIRPRGNQIQPLRRDVKKFNRELGIKGKAWKSFNHIYFPWHKQDLKLHFTNSHVMKAPKL